MLNNTALTMLDKSVYLVTFLIWTFCISGDRFAIFTIKDRHMKHHRPLYLTVAIALLFGSLVACSATNHHQKRTIEVIDQSQTKPSQVPPRPAVIHHPPADLPAPSAPPIQAAPMPAPTPKQHYASFDDWKADFVQRAIAQGYPASGVHQLMHGAKLNQQVIALDGKQAEFAKMPWEYVESAASTNRIQQGKTQLNEYPSLLSRLENTYNVPKEIVVAIWGLESSYGAGTGTMNLVNALSSLAFDGRRRAFAETELLSMIQLIDHGDVNQHELKGSWAGGMGHTQFIPSTWLKQGVDGNNDGKKHPWTISDALASTANYLRNSGWVAGSEVFYEVRLPSQFDYALIGQKLPLDTWKNHGVLPIGGEYFGGQTPAQLWLPAGINGPALLTTPNFEAIKVYNNSSNYALGVAVLGKRISNKSGIISAWPRHERPLSRQQIKQLQHNLSSRGYDTGGTDGIAGANTRRAFARWQADNGKVPDGFISQNSASALLW